ncbi:MAG: hypothetical protein M4579_007468 [Chaenotheca gracillima]|nr:MAG: hypothetical protein M4579_007468 [Chaenotheca gracillima]
MGRQDSNDDDSRERLPSMQELEPSPVEDTPDLERDSYFPKESTAPPSERPSARSSTLGLSGGGGHGVAYYLMRIQKYSSYTASAFLVMHITNTSLIPLATRSVNASENYLLLTRPYYQSPFAEPLVVALPIVAHVVSGIALRIYRRHQIGKRYDKQLYTRAERRRFSDWPKVSATSVLGFTLWPLVTGHILVNRVLPLWAEGDSSGVGLGYVSHGFAKYPVVATTLYAALVGVGSWHFVKGWAKWMGWAPEQVGDGISVGSASQKRRRRWLTHVVSAFVASLWMAGGLGVVGRGGAAKGWIGRGWDDLYARIPLSQKLF